MLQFMKDIFTTMASGVWLSMKSPRGNIVFNPLGNPRPSAVSPSVPWWGSVVMIVIGLVAMCMGHVLQAPDISEVAKLIVVLTVGNLLGMSIATAKNRGG